MRRLLGLFCIAAAGCTGLVGEPDDAGLPVEVDSGVIDAGEPPDAGVDAGPQDAGPSIGLDSRPVNTTCIAPSPPPNASGVTTQRVFPALAFNQPLGLFNPPGDPTRVWVQERAGVIRSFPNQNDAGVGSLTTVLDFGARVNDQGEGGFLGMAFHPQWPTVLEVFISYTETAAPLRTVISRFKSLDSGATLSLASEEKLFTIDQPYDNHNGGSISFGPDGLLYIGLGDGGSGGDPLNAGQRLNTNSDFGSGKIATVQPDGTGGFTAGLLVDTNISLASFGQLADGEIYALDIGTGQVHKLVPSGTAPVDTFPRLLSQTGCFDPADPKRPVAALVPYDVNAALWSDGASKQRFFAIPDGTTISVQPSGDFDFPNGTVLAKTFSLGGKRIETRLFMRHLNGTWAGYSYEWNDLETEATLLPGSKSRVVGAQTWSYPSRGQCLQCHTAIAGRSLGLELGQLNSALVYPATGRTGNQLFTLASLGFFSAPLSGPVATLPRYEPPFATGPLEPRARAYLHANCAGCHQQGAGQGPADWRYSLSLRNTNTCNVAPQNGTLGITGAMLIAPGSPSTSIVSRRIHALNAARMPPVGSSLEDAQGTALVDQWISSLSSCPP